MEEVFCTDKRQTPLKVGSVKSNLGHCEVSGLFISIVKAIIALDGGYIPPNINYTEPNENVAALKSGKIQVRHTRNIISTIFIDNYFYWLFYENNNYHQMKLKWLLFSHL